MIDSHKPLKFLELDSERRVPRPECRDLWQPRLLQSGTNLIKQLSTKQFGLILAVPFSGKDLLEETQSLFGKNKYFLVPIWN